MKDKGRTRGTFKVYLQWPLFLSVLLVILTAAVGAVSIKAGIIVSVFTIVYIGIALWLYFSRKRGILAGLIAFSSAYDQSRQNLMEEMLMPYAVADGTVYFRVKKFKEYGKLSHKNLDDLQSGFRSLQVSGEDQKEDPLDFVLWKPKKEGEPFWKSPWCDGRPGWHIECSVMSKKYLGEEIDIHAGGEDLVFPHHENEIAQSECCNGVPFAKYWMHNAFLNIDNRKMSKSLGNFRTVREIGDQYDLQVLRFFMLNAHYRSPLNFSADLMESSKNALERITEAAARLRDRQAAATVQEATEDEKKLMQEEAAFVTKFEESMDDDFNTADALAAVFELVKFANTNVQEGSSKEFAGHTLEVMTKLCDVLGLTLEKKEEILDEEIENLIAERQAARKAKDFARADEIRGLLLDKGIELKDTREGVKWKRI